MGLGMGLGRQLAFEIPNQRDRSTEGQTHWTRALGGEVLSHQVAGLTDSRVHL